MTISAALVLAFAGFAFAAETNPAGKWELQYFYDENESTLTLTDLKFPSPQRGIASGYITRRVSNALLGDHEKAIPVVLVTANGGKSWDRVVTKEVADSLFFLNDSIGWMATENGIWTTSESGRSWKRISTLKNLRQVFFVNPTHGFAAGDGDRILQTDDGGVTWLPIRWAGTPPKSMAVVYRVIVFADARNGIVAGEVPSSDEDPDVPIRLLRPRKQIDAFAYTHDGGATWRRSINSRYGEMTRSSMGPDGIGLALLQYPQSYTWPSEIFTLDLNDDVANHLLYRSHDHAITDVLLNPGGDSYAAGYQPPGDIHPSPIPGKVRVLRSRDLKVWEEMAVDYRAVARQVWLASPTAASVWLATDTGMILKLNTP